MNTLTGSAPKATFSTQPTILPAQNDLLNALVGILTTGDPVKGVQKYTGSYAQPLNSLQNQSLAGLEALAMPESATAPISKSGQQQTGIDQAFNALTGALSYQAPQIDSTEAFQKGVVDPLTASFESEILPALSGKYARGAGGAYSSGVQQASQQAGASLLDTLGAEGSKFAYNAASANQNAELQANQQRLAALGLAPSITAAPTAIDQTIATTNMGLTTERLRQLLGVLQGGEVARSVGQTELAGQYGEFTRQQQEEQQIIADFIAAMGAPTVQTSGVGSAGSSGLLQGLMGGLSGFGGSFGNWLFGGSDERIKDDIEHVGDVDGFPLYRFRYKDEPKTTPRRIGFMAQDIEKRLPEAVAHTNTGVKLVNYGAVIEHVLKEAA